MPGMIEDEPLACIQKLGAHNRKISAFRPLPAHAQAHSNCNLSAICLYLRPCRGITKSRIKIEDSAKSGGNPNQVHAIEDLPNLD